MSDRLRELLRQRALLQEHLTWLDREIAAESRPGPASPPPWAEMPPVPAVADLPTAPVVPAPMPHSPAAAVISIRPAPSTASVAAAANPDAILEEYRVAPAALQQDIRRGCFFYFAAALVVFALGVVVLYFLLSSR
jgi:hypothetical protein